MKSIYFFLALIFEIFSEAHMAMFEPCPRYSIANKKCPAPPPGQSYDYEIKSPIGKDDGIISPLCKNTTPFSIPTETWTAGHPVTISFEAGGAAHGGGHCQFALSYDEGKTFVVVYDVKKYCFFNGPSSSNEAQKLSYTFTLPESVPAAETVIFAWSWINAIGNREFYMNCADITIKSSSLSFSGPQMLIANYGSQYPVIPEFNENYNTGLDLFDGRPIITVNASRKYIDGTDAKNQTTIEPKPKPKPKPTLRLLPTSTQAIALSQEQRQTKSTKTNFQLRTSRIARTKPRSGENTQSKTKKLIKTKMRPKPTQVPGVKSQETKNTSCIHGKMRCDRKNPYVFYICNFGEEVKMDVAKGTKCRSAPDGYILQDFA